MKRLFKSRKRLIWTSAVFLALFLLAFRIYWIPSVEVKVIDAETKEPIEGVVFLGYWEKYSGTMAGRYRSGILEVKELVTDKNGKAGYFGWVEVMFRGEWIERDGGKGGIYATYKNGYGDRNGTFRFKDGEVIELPKFEGDARTQRSESHFYDIVVELRSVESFPCIWEEIPKSLVARETMSALAYNESEDS
ncbi:MAG: hypothetical protein WBM41_05775, partial [Arenicellales bacterium]